jgi:uncharacterized protein RhaS with RHS repeats
MILYTARWLQRDPIDAASGDPNLYRYATNDPINYADDGMRGSSRQRGVGSKKSLVFAQRKIALLAVGDTKSNWWSQWAVNRGVRRDVALLQRRFSAAGYKGKKVNGCASTGSGKQPQRVSREVKLAMHRMSRVVS